MFVAVGAFGADTNLFNKNEFKADIFGTYQDSQDWGYGIGVSYYLTKNFGLAASTGKRSLDWANGKFFEDLTTVGLVRVPINKNLSPYVLLGSYWEIEKSKNIPIAGLGLEYRFSRRLGCFIEGTYGFGTWGKWDLPDAKEVGVKGGVRFAVW